MKNANESPKITYSAMVIRNPYPGPDHHQKFFDSYFMNVTTYFCRLSFNTVSGVK